MAQLDFYGTQEDIIELIDFMFLKSPMRLFEAYSKKDSEIREFFSGQDILESTHIKDNHGCIFVRGWWESVATKPSVKRIDLNPDVGKFRYTLEGVGTFQILQGDIKNTSKNSMKLSSFSHWNEAGAKERANCSDEEILDVNWKEFRRLSGIVHRHVRNKMNAAKLKNTPILSGAFSFLKQGGKLWGPSQKHSIDSNEIQIKNS